MSLPHRPSLSHQTAQFDSQQRFTNVWLWTISNVFANLSNQTGSNNNLENLTQNSLWPNDPMVISSEDELSQNSTRPFTYSSSLTVELNQIQWRHPILCVIMICACLLTIAGNCLVVLAVCTKKYLRNPTGYLIVSLAVADLIVGLVVMPLNSLLEATRHVWLLGLLTCDLFHALDILASTSSIWNLCVISLDRYLAGHDPIGYRDRVSKRRILIAIAFVWIISAFISFPAIIWWRKSSPHLYNDRTKCLFTDSELYVIFSSMVSFYIPLCLILFSYGRVFLIATRHTQSLLSGEKRIGSTKFGRGSRRTAKEIRISENGEKILKPHNGSPRCSALIGAETLRIHFGRKRKPSTPSNVVVTAGDSSNHISQRLVPTNQINKDMIDARKRSYNSFRSIKNEGGQRKVISPKHKASMDSGTLAGPRSRVNTNDEDSLSGSSTVQSTPPPPTSVDTPLIRSTCGVGGSDKLRSVNRRKLFFRPSASSASLLAPQLKKSGILKSQSPENTILENMQALSAEGNLLQKLSNATAFSTSEFEKSVVESSGSYQLALSGEGQEYHPTNGVYKYPSSKRKFMGGLGVREKSRQMMKYMHEQRAARTLSIVVGVFILCWMPFFILTPIMAFCKNCIGSQETIFSIITWAGHLNSMMNPLIYSRFSRDFRKAFKQILTCKNERTTKKAIKSPLNMVLSQLAAITQMPPPKPITESTDT